MKKTLLSFIAMALSAIAMQAQGTITIPNVSFEPGETKNVAIELSNETGYCGFQMDVVLPDGFSIPMVENEDEELVLAVALDAARKKTSHTIECKAITGATRIVSYSSSNATYKGTSGALVNISVKASESITPGSYSIELKNIEFATPDEVSVRFNNVSSSLQVNGSVSQSYSAVVNCGTGGEAVLSASIVNGGDPLKLFIAPNDGYKVASLKLNGNNVNVKNNIYSIVSVSSNVVFDVAFEVVKPDTIEVEKIVTDTIEIEKIITDTIVVEKIVTDTIEIEKIITDTIEIETIEIDTIYLAEINEVPAPEITFADGKLNISCALQGAKIYYSLDGTFPTTEYTAPVAVDKDCVVMAIAAFVSEVSTKEIIDTGIGGVNDEIVSYQYFTEAGVEIDEPCEGINIVVIKYASGKTETKKVVVRKK